MSPARDTASWLFFITWITVALLVVRVDASEDAAVGSEVSDAEAAAARERVKAADDKARESIEKSKASDAKFMQTFQSLQKKLDGWKATIATAGADADPVLKEKAEALEKDLKEMGVEYMKTVGTEDLDGSGQFANDDDTYGPLMGCIVLSVKELGQQRATTQKALRMLTEMEGDVDVSALANEELWRMVSECLGSLTNEEYSDFKAGKLQKLPAAYVEAASSPEAKQKVLEISAPVWKVIQSLAKQVVKQADGEQTAAPPFAAGMLAMIPVCLGIAFFGKLFRDMQMREAEKRSKKENKYSKKSK